MDATTKIQKNEFRNIAILEGNAKWDDSDRSGEQITCPLEIKLVGTVFKGELVVVLLFSDINDLAILEYHKKKTAEQSKYYSHSLLHVRSLLIASRYITQSASEDRRVSRRIKDEYLIPAGALNILLMSIVNDYTDFYSIVMNRLKLLIKAKSVRRTIDDCVKWMTTHVQRKELYLRVEYQIETSTATIRTDHERLRQIILNLLINAIKLTIHGGVTISVRLFNKEQEGKMLEVRVSDTGVGYSGEQKRKIMDFLEKLEPEDQQSRAAANGVELGLIVSNHLVKALGPADEGGGGGKGMMIESEINKGNKFSFVIADKVLDEDSILNLSEIDGQADVTSDGEANVESSIEESDELSFL